MGRENRNAARPNPPPAVECRVFGVELVKNLGMMRPDGGALVVVELAHQKRQRAIIALLLGMRFFADVAAGVR